MRRANVSAIAGIVHQLCPRCRAGKIFRKSLFLFPKMHERCPACDLKFEREEGYFLGAMYIGYGLAIVTIAILAAALWFFLRWRIDKAVIWATLLFLPSAPFLTLLARVLWIYLDQAIDPDKTGLP
jgi:uncharacterized protein (DUF983 family)